MSIDLLGALSVTAANEKPAIRKLGTIECNLVEATPVVWKGRLYRFEYVHALHKSNDTGDTYFRFVDVETGEYTPAFAQGYHLGSAYVHEDTLYAYGVRWYEPQVYVFRSDDMATWHSQTAVELPGWGPYNTSVCNAPDGYVMAIELGEPPEVVGHRFTMRFARSEDLLNWTIMPQECVFARDRYTACPAIRFVDGWYYMVYLEEFAGPTYNPHIVRSRDLITWESSPLNPVLEFSDEDKQIANPNLTSEERAHIAGAVNINNSDVDLCEFDGSTVIYYSWGSQKGIEFLAEAVYEGSVEQFLKGWFGE